MADMSGLRRPSGANLVYENLRERIVSLEIEPGARLSEVNLASQLGVSRTPVREALNRLLSEGLAAKAATGGMYASELDATDMRQLYTVRAVLEGVIAREASQRITPADITIMDSILDRQELMVEHEAESYRLGGEFHQHLAKIAGNERVDQILELIWGHVRRYRGVNFRSIDRRRAACEEHRALGRAVAAGDAELAERRAREHIDSACHNAVLALEQEAAAPVTS
ncbi:GntR family transcriptional regulator [Rhodococcus sp. T2V]|uniref:GntR family transcriptional regulator n=1 Tax=Rhodococcus sp. T2V TaxID=3034164 RepID=UPI0023E1E4D2|nr:GntR family transcriptional regulator [Rhodococcus sp. T2V]MDF3312042.1 GntR family transcriptional regulator [Rhodococcus sp. T2V]